MLSRGTAVHRRRSGRPSRGRALDLPAPRLPAYEDGLSLFLRAPDGQERHARLQWCPEAQGPVVDALDRYLSPETPRLPTGRIALTRDSMCMADDADAPHDGTLAVDEAADLTGIAEALLASNYLAHVGSNAIWWLAAGGATAALGFRDRMPFARAAPGAAPGPHARDIAHLHVHYAAQADADAFLASRDGGG